MKRLSSLRARLLAIVMTTTLVALVFALLGNVAGNAWVLHQQNMNDLQSQAELMGRMNRPALVFDDPQLATNNLAQFEARPRILAAAIHDQRGRLFAGYSAPGQDRKAPPTAMPAGAGIEGGDIVVVRPIEQSGEIIGSVYLRAEAGIGNSLLRGLAIAGIGGVLAMVLAYLMVRRLEPMVTRPITAVAAAARDVVQRRDYSRRVDKQDEDQDFGGLVDAFNAMLVEVQARTEQLRQSFEDLQREAEKRHHAQEQVQRLNQDLEQRVAARTQDLELSNRELSLAKAAADDASKAKSSFLATMSHEIRTPMNGVIGMIDVLHQSSLRGDQVEMVGLIRDSAFSLLAIIDDILDFSKIEAGRMEVESAPLSVLGIVEAACGMLDNFAVKRGVELTCHVDPTLPPRLMGDALRLRQVLVNLVNNAIKFSSGMDRPGRVWVRAMCVERTPGHVYLQLSVTDNGIGMDQAMQTRLFTAFSQADSSTTRRYGGSGLGLAISYRLLELMGGQIEVRSEPGQGSCFTASVLLAEAPADQAAEDAAPSGPDLAGLRCLVLGSANSLAADLAAALGAAGLRVELLPSHMASAEHLETALAASPVMVVDRNGLDPAVLERIVKHAPASAGLLLLGRGPRRLPRRNAAGHVEIDGNAMTRKRLLQSLAMAAGRDAGQGQPDAKAGRPPVHLPTREEALAAGRLILVAEDNEFNQQVVLRQLQLLGHAADLAADGERAWSKWQETDYALLLTDLHMPLIDGYELTRRIRGVKGRGRNTVIVALTANALQGESERCLAVGMDGYLAKPLVIEDLRRALERWLPAAQTPVDGCVLSVDVLRDFVGDEPGAVYDFLGKFEHNAARTHARLEAAWQARDLVAVGEQAHSLKTSALMVGAQALAGHCGVLEDAGGRQDLPAIEQAMPGYRAELARVQDAAAGLLAHRG